MKESTTYQAILHEGLQEGRVEGAILEARNLLFQLGTKKLGPPTSRTKKALEKITDLNRLENLIKEIGEVENWQALLTSNRSKHE